ncbi:MAG: response regulator [Patescibacteria group bacterium]|jgi:CheY-like chemotaxis protein
MKKIILAVDDDRNDRELLKLYLEYSFKKCPSLEKNMPFIRIAKDGEDAWDILTKEKVTPNVMIVDYKMTGMNGVELIKKTKGELGINPIFVICSDHSLAETEAREANCMFVKKGEREKFRQLTEKIRLFIP